ncbi:hypothetical protein LSM04_004828 [Trypanosoma melophagium]|uniref:uncharacterized protein n=1 Tax=Trypanosoma melophagium TaxID=715481 RepID=UPI00351A9525|nr:hypothetical protein LSM04_004828 [Trypanosoma melophagium]
MNRMLVISILPLSLSFSFLLCLLLVLSSIPSAVMPVNAADPGAHAQQKKQQKQKNDDVDGDLASHYLAMLTVEDLQQMLHEKHQPFHHLRTKQELIRALVKIEQEEELALKVQAGATQHVLRVLYCSG